MKIKLSAIINVWRLHPKKFPVICFEVKKYLKKYILKSLFPVQPEKGSPRIQVSKDVVYLGQDAEVSPAAVAS